MNKWMEPNPPCNSIVCQVLIYYVALVALAGWILNLVKTIDMLGDPITLMFMLRLIGIVIVPIGSILGYIPT